MTYIMMQAKKECGFLYEPKSYSIKANHPIAVTRHSHSFENKLDNVWLQFLTEPRLHRNISYVAIQLDRLTSAQREHFTGAPQKCSTGVWEYVVI